MNHQMAVFDGRIKGLKKRSQKNHAKRYNLENKAKSPGQPRTPQYIEEAIIVLRQDNPLYGCQRIAKYVVSWPFRVCDFGDNCGAYLAKAWV